MYSDTNGVSLVRGVSNWKHKFNLIRLQHLSQQQKPDFCFVCLSSSSSSSFMFFMVVEPMNFSLTI